MSIQSIQTVIVKACRAGVGLAFCVLIGAVLYQVIGRSIGMSSVWTEELTRYALLYVAAFGVGLSLLSGDLVNVDVICGSGKCRRHLRVLARRMAAAPAAILGNSNCSSMSHFAWPGVEIYFHWGPPNIACNGTADGLCPRQYLGVAGPVARIFCSAGCFNALGRDLWAPREIRR